MSALPLSAYFDHNLGAPVIENPALSIHGANPWVNAMRRGAAMARQRAAMMQQYRQQQAAQNAMMGMDPYDVGAMMGEEAIDVGFDEDFEIQGIDDEIAALESESCTVFGADGTERLGASLNKINRKIKKYEALVSKLTTKLETNPGWRKLRAKRLKNRLERSKGNLAKWRERLSAKGETYAARTGQSPEAVAMQLESPGVGGGLAITEWQIAQAKAQRELGILGAIQRSPYEGQEVRIPLKDDITNLPLTVITVGAGAGARTVAITMSTPTIAYADFEVIGLDTHLQSIQPSANEQLVSVLVSNLSVDGKLNLVYDPVDVAFAGQTVGTTVSSARTIGGLRDNPTLEKTNQASLTATFRQEITTTETISAVFKAALVVRVRSDVAAQRGQVS